MTSALYQNNMEEPRQYSEEAVAHELPPAELCAMDTELSHCKIENSNLSDDYDEKGAQGLDDGEAEALKEDSGVEKEVVEGEGNLIVVENSKKFSTNETGSGLLETTSKSLHPALVEYSGKLVNEPKNAIESMKTSNVSPEDATVVKLLVSHLVAGGIIGRNGHEITTLQNVHQVHIKLSASREFFPGTQDRVVLLNGGRASVLAAIKYIINRVRDEALHEFWENGKTQTTSTNVQMNLKLVVPKSSVGVLIGKSGAQVKELQDSTGCKIYILKDNFDIMRVKERVCLLWGNEHQVEEATRLIIATIHGSYKSELPETVSYPSYNAQYTGSPSAALKQLIPPSIRSHSYGKSIFNLAMSLYRRPEILQFFNTIDIQIPALYAGCIIGSNGRTVSEIQNLTGTSIQMSPKESCETCMGNRKLSISGPMYGVLEAYVAIIEKLISMQQSNVKGETAPMEQSYSNLSRKPPGGLLTADPIYGCQIQNLMNSDMRGYGGSNQSFSMPIAPVVSYYGGSHPRSHYPNLNTIVGAGYVGQPESVMVTHQSGPSGYDSEYLHSQGVSYWNM